MPEQPSTWAYILNLLQSAPAALQGAFMAFVVAILRLIYDGREHLWTRKIIEATLCGFLALASGGILDWLGLDSTAMLLPVSAIIGFIGVEGLRELAHKYTGYGTNRCEDDKADKQ